MQPEPQDELKQIFDSLRGKILGMIEMLALSETQERGCKVLFKSMTYDAQAEISELLEELEHG